MKKILFYFSLMTCLVMSAVASEETYSKHYRGNQITPGKTMTMQSPRYYLTNWSIVEPTVKVRLYLAEDRMIGHSISEDYYVVYDITLTDTTNSEILVRDTLHVSYRPSTPYQDFDINEYRNIKSASLTILAASSDMTEDIVFELQMNYYRCTGEDSIKTIRDVNSTYCSNTNELLVTWKYADGADEYDLEWLFVDNPVNSNLVPYDFSNATRITISDNHYFIPLAYPKGNILYRVRGRGSHHDHGVFYPVFGPWSFSASSGSALPVISSVYRYDYEGLEDSLTWQYTSVYAEEGKRKEVITFYDGTLRNRQSVTVLNTDSVAIVSETFYDHIGRQALQSIPAPTPSRGIRYYGTNNSSNGLFNGDYPKMQYDNDISLTNGQKFPPNAGSAVYYSPDNPFVNNSKWPNVNQTPKDSGYTYTHIRYLNDGTDRVHSQSGVGSTFKMGGGHDTRYYYGNPTQVELDRLFGNEVGDASHYQKVIAVDPNNEVTVSYYDMKERLIASAIIPNIADTALLPVDFTPASHADSSLVLFNDSSRQYVQNIAVSLPTNIFLSYSVSTPLGLMDTCSGDIGCIDCRYLLVFSLWNTDGLYYVFKDSLVVSEGDVITHNDSLQPGNYQLYKSISLVEDDISALDFERFAERQRPCVHYTKADTLSCYTPCEEYAMEQAGINRPDTTNQTYIQTLRECENPPQSYSTECEARRAAMLADMSPGGQYFDNIRTCCPGDHSCYCPSKHNGFLRTICSWRLAEDTVLNKIKTDSNFVDFDDDFWDYIRENWKSEYAEVMFKYHPEYHLYKALCDCGDSDYDSVFMNTYDYDSAVAHGFFNPLGLELNYSIQIQPNSSDGYQPFKASTIDPFFNKLYSCCPDMIDSIRQITMNKLYGYLSWDDNNLSLWWLLENPAQIDSNNCPAQFLPIKDVVLAMDSMITLWSEYYNNSKNAKWMLFKSSYIYLKDKIRRTVLPACFLNCNKDSEHNGDSCCYNPAFQWGQESLWQNMFDICSSNVCELYLATDRDCPSLPLTVGSCSEGQGGFQVRFLCDPVYDITIDNYLELSDNSLQTVYKNCCEDCEAYANSWMEDLRDYFRKNCSGILDDTAKWHALREQLINWCIESCDSSLVQKDFSIKQRIHPDSLENFFEENCFVYSENYPRIVFPSFQDMYMDCGCNNYRSFLNSNDLTFWNDASDIAQSLDEAGMSASFEDIENWNHFCIWTRYDSLLAHVDDTSTLYSYNFPKEFRCRPDLPDSILCRQEAILAAAAQDSISFYRALDSLVVSHKAAYTSHCLDKIQESLAMKTSSSEFLYTLYYYDQADNLIKTVPPKGVHVIDDQTTLDAIVAYRNNNARYDTLHPGFIRPNHTMVTNYRYNSLNQVIQSYQPDHDSVSYVYYDILSRPVLSQDGKQRQQNKYSYTVYDTLGRIKEVGQVRNSTLVTRKDAANLIFFNQFLNNGIKSEITTTWYDEPMPASPNLNQTHLRNRIAAVSFAPADDSIYQSVTHYSYDIHGNVKRLVQEIPALESYGRRFTVLDYEYDLISGNVNSVWYQKGKMEQFSHRYRYDADNRITHVYTSNIFKIKRDSAILHERLEARYFYLPTGVLSRTELGHKQIQGIDYAYTLQGWLKDINGYRCGFYDLDDESVTFDIGEDACVRSDNYNRLFAHDEFSTSIQYYPNDYMPILGGNFFNDPSSDAVPLYNGNISALTTSNYHIWIPSMLKLFRYDKLNRIKSMQTAAHSFNPTGWESVCDNYSTQYTYDWNGNLLFLQRKNQFGEDMHQVDYNYPSNSNNRLGGIAATGLQSGSYQYDALGNLVCDNAEGLTVSWNALGKVDTIQKNGLLLTRFQYSPTGQRQVKASLSDTIYYIHDATGNVMCIYRFKGDTLTATERYIYGNKRLGVLGQQVWITAGGIARLQDTNTIGQRTYELTDHLGNVTATILDRKQFVYYSGNVPISVPYTVTYTDYYPFGFPMPGRSYYNGGYRYFFNGQEADNEVLGEGALHAFEYRMHDTRIGRFWSVDPLAGKFPWNSVYAFAENRVVDGRELEGLERDPKTLTTTNVEIPIKVVNPVDQLKVVPVVSPKTELKLQPSTKTVYVIDPGEIRPAKSEYEKWWEFTAGPFANYMRYDYVLQGTSTGFFLGSLSLYGYAVLPEALPYVVRGGERLYSLGINVYNNPWGKRIIGGSLGIIANKQNWSPDITFPDPMIGTYSLLFQFLSDTWEKNKDLFDDKLRIDSKTFPQNTNDNAKSNHTRSTEKKD